MEKYIGFWDVELLYPETVLNSIINSNCFPDKLFGFSMNIIISYANNDSFLCLSFQFFMPFSCFVH